MKRLLFLILLLPLTCFGYVAQFDIQAYSQKHVALNTYSFMDLNKQSSVIPMTCKIFTKYTGNIYTLINAGVTPRITKGINVSSMKPFTITVSGQIDKYKFGDNSILFMNRYGCSVVNDGKKCQDAKNNNSDYITVSCFEADK
jgi:hypothetical protein